MNLRAGDVFVRNGTALPDSLQLASDDEGSWKKLRDIESYTLELLVLKAGWHFFYLTPPVETGGMGMSRQSAINHAGNKVLNLISQSGFNSLEITRIAGASIAGLHHVHIVAHARHLRPSPYIFDPDPNYYPRLAEQFEEFFWKVSEIQSQSHGV